MKLQTGTILALVSTLALFAGCHKQVAVVNPPQPPPQAVAQKVTPPAPSQPIAVAVAEKTTVKVPDSATKARIQDLLNRIQDVYFDYDKHTLRPDAQTTLESDANTLRLILADYPSYKLTVEGFCDERGSDAYNLALGDSRALKAQQFLETLGLPAAQLTIISYGKEKPVCTEHTEACWAKNRRAHITQDQKGA